MFRKIAQPFYTAYVILIFVATLLVVLPFYFLLSLPKTTQSRWMIWKLTSSWSRVWLRLTGMWVKQIGKLPIVDKYVVIANHISYLDPIVIYDVLPFFFRPLAKYEIAKIPVVGFVYAQIAILVNRSSASKRAKSMLQMQSTLEHECSIFMYPEGTFNETNEPMKSFYDGAFRLAIETQTDILPILFPDTNLRWHNSAWWKMWPGQNRAIILPVISTKGLTNEDLLGLKENTRNIMAKELKTIQG